MSDRLVRQECGGRCHLEVIIAFTRLSNHDLSSRANSAILSQGFNLRLYGLIIMLFGNETVLQHSSDFRRSLVTGCPYGCVGRENDL